MTIRFSSNDSKLRNNTVALTSESFAGRTLTLHANNTSNSNTAGGIAKDGATVELSSTITSYTVNLDGDIVMGDTTNAKFIKLNGTKITVNPSVEAGATAIIGSKNSNGTYRTMTFTNGGDGTYTITYNTANTLSNSDSTFYLKGSFNNQGNTDVFKKTDNSDIITITKELSAGKYTFNLYNLATDKSYGKNNTVITDTTNRLVLVNSGDACVLNATGGIYEFKYEISTNRLSIYSANKAVSCIGDCNDDGTFNIADVILLQKWLLAVPNVTLPNWKAADLCEDDRLDVFDLCMMKRLLLNS
ncbi:MAG: dockerin type I repeat-containing protein [Ruminococcus sp.]|nr:dockerin type I repeat-containing protein [Ruminococcus sp.]